MENQIRKLIDTDINPSLAYHDGGVELISVKEVEGMHLVSLRYNGACAGCPSSEGETLYMIENFLIQELGNNNIKVVKEVD